MCGIVGIHALGGSPPPPSSRLRGMIDTLRHRGPDGTGEFADADTALGHARLSIIDLEGGKQPIHNEDASVWVTVNGEIFNHIELRRELEDKGHRFYTRSDSEVIVHAYEEHGPDAVLRLNGQFAFALWDTRQKRLVLARDRVGIRPLYYAVAKGHLYFASEIKALFATGVVSRELSPAALAEIFTFWSNLPPRTPFAGVEALPPGHVLTIEQGDLRLTRYWDWSFAETASSTRSTDDYADELRELLTDSVRLQLRSDVPVGAYLSGGLDSSIVTALAQKITRSPLQTFSIGFEDESLDESQHQRDIVRHLGTLHTEYRCTRNRIAAVFPRAIWHAESPIVRTAPIPLLMLSGIVRAERYKVVLTGEGADEAFAGYDLFKEAKIRRFCARVPGSRLRPLILKRLYPYLKHSPVGAGALGQSFFLQGLEHVDRPIFAHLPRWTTTRRIWRFFTPEIRQELRAWDPLAAVEASLPADIRRWPPLGRDQYVEAHTLMSGYLLSSQGDRMAMANSVEGRFPYLDHRLLEFANRLPPELKMRGLTEKYILRRAFRGLLPPAVEQRPKQPYQAPDSPSFFNAGHAVSYVDELLAEPRLREAGLFDPAAVRNLYAKCRAGRAIGFGDNMAFVAVLSTMLVDELFVRNRSVDSLTDRPQVADEVRA